MISNINSLYIGRSKIHGKGVFSNRNFRKDEDISYIEGKIIRSPSDKEKANSIQVGDNAFFKPTGVFRFLNHSCNPNAKLILSNDSLFLKAKKEIQKDDEITFNYCSSDYKLIHTFTCNCDSCRLRNIKKTISGYKDLTLNEKNKIIKDALPYLIMKR